MQEDKVAFNLFSSFYSSIWSEPSRFHFRAWYEDRHGVREMRYFQLGDDMPVSEDYSMCLSEPMQSTGLTDKNGKEIFERDILSPPNCSTHKRWIDVHWPFVHLQLPFGVKLQDCEIVGNQYENPDLPEERYA